MPILHLLLDGGLITAGLEDNETTRSLIAQLPLTLVLDDFAAAEKIAYLPDRLSTDDAPDGFKPRAGDITYYAPWGNLAIFYRDRGYARGLVPLGRITDGMEKLHLATGTKHTLELKRILPPESCLVQGESS